MKKVFCFQCVKAKRLGLLNLIKKADAAFLSIGFSDWKHATAAFHKHQSSEMHKHACSQLKLKTGLSIDAKISASRENEQKRARVALVALFSSLRYLARQGIAIRGSDTDSGNYNELLRLRGNECEPLKEWLTKVTNFTSPESQNEMITMIQSYCTSKNCCNNSR